VLAFTGGSVEGLHLTDDEPPRIAYVSGNRVLIFPMLSGESVST